ncbi:L-threonylcarbamoyladenylate synthase [Nocardioides sp. ChNu-99]|uniref:L-threonylcarbamoyladenylate synthase n=1 Tax=unclassified Nocardioides TaxID=2615069 RepID=UPI0032171FB6
MDDAEQQHQPQEPEHTSGEQAPPAPPSLEKTSSRVRATGTEDEREAALEAATLAVRQGSLVVLPTDTVYGVGADAFDPDAVGRLLAAKGRGREMPPPVLISAAVTADALARSIPGWARALMDAFWPGPLTLVLPAQTSLQWDLGDTRGTVALRMPDHDVARELLERTGPLAVSSANLTGRPAALTAAEADGMLGASVEVVLDAGRSPRGEASTIVDATGDQGRVLRVGALSLEQLNTVLEPQGATLVDQG